MAPSRAQTGWTLRNLLCVRFVRPVPSALVTQMSAWVGLAAAVEVPPAGAPLAPGVLLAAFCFPVCC